jgi:viroplasmin and RNaseH domain-containing protein
MSKRKAFFYAVGRGHTTGIFPTWCVFFPPLFFLMLYKSGELTLFTRDEAKKHVDGFSNAKVQKCNTRKEAQEFVNRCGEEDAKEESEEKPEVKQATQLAMPKTEKGKEKEEQAFDAYFAYKGGWWGAIVTQPTPKKYAPLSFSS